MKKLFFFCVILAYLSVPVYSLPTFGLTSTDSSGMAETGNLDTFTRIIKMQSSGVQGHNTDAISQYSEVDKSVKSILLSSIFSIDSGGKIYHELIFDITENIFIAEPLMFLEDLLLFDLTSSTLASFNLSDNSFSISIAPFVQSFGKDE